MPPSPDDRRSRVIEYHDGTKHHFNRFARSLGYLDWASQPRPFRTWHGSRTIPLAPRPDAPPISTPSHATFDALGEPGHTPLPMDDAGVGLFLRYALGLSAWKAIASARWALRVNPSSGNLHPTEAYVVRGSQVWHYAPERHALEARCHFDAAAWDVLGLRPDTGFLIGLTSIHWREAWKYGERAFRYCQHDLGHAMAAVAYSAALCGWRATAVPDCPSHVLAALLGLDRADDFIEAEPEEAGVLLLISDDGAFQVPPMSTWPGRPLAHFSQAVAGGTWTGRASQLSEDHVQWTFIDDVAEASRRDAPAVGEADASQRPWTGRRSDRGDDRGLDAAALFLRRRSAVAFDGLSGIDRADFFRILSRTLPHAGTPLDVWPRQPRVHLIVFVHRVRDLAPGVYLLLRRPEAESLLRAPLTAFPRWDRASDELPFFQLRAGDCRQLAQRLSCDQAIAADGCCSFGMLAELDHALDVGGPAAYRELFWETGLVGQVLYLEAEAAGLRGTGIGCFYDDPVHEVLGVADHAVQSLYHFTLGEPVEDRRLTTEPGYDWERSGQDEGRGLPQA